MERKVFSPKSWKLSEHIQNTPTSWRVTWESRSRDFLMFRPRMHPDNLATHLVFDGEALPEYGSNKFLRLMSLMDVENAAIALIDEDQEEGVKRFFDKHTDLLTNYVDRMLKTVPFDCVLIHDDWGHQTPMMNSSAILRKTLCSVTKTTISVSAWNIQIQPLYLIFMNTAENYLTVKNYRRIKYDVKREFISNVKGRETGRLSPNKRQPYLFFFRFPQSSPIPYRRTVAILDASKV